MLTSCFPIKSWWIKLSNPSIFSIVYLFHMEILYMDVNKKCCKCFLHSLYKKKFLCLFTRLHLLLIQKILILIFEQWLKKSNKFALYIKLLLSRFINVHNDSFLLMSVFLTTAFLIFLTLVFLSAYFRWLSLSLSPPFLVPSAVWLL